MNDEAILLGLKGNNSNAIEQFWIKYYDRIHPICAFILGQCPDARDITVDILVDFIERHCKNLGSHKAIYAFLRQAAIRRSIRFKDRRNRFSDVELDAYVSEEMSPEERADLNMMIPFLNQCLSELTPKAQASLRLKYSRKISNERIGEMLGGSKSYIGRLLKSGRDMLGRCIENKMKKALAESPGGGAWQQAPRPLLTGAAVEQLLSARPTSKADVCEHIERLSLAIEQYSDESEIRWADRHVQRCEVCRETVLFLAGRAAAAPKEIDFAPRHPYRPSARPYVVRGMAAAAGILLVLGVLFAIKPAIEAPPSEEQTLVPKGVSSDKFFVAAKRRGASFPIHPLDRVLSGDQLGLFYTMEEEGFLAVFSRDDAGMVTPLYPTEGDTSALVSLGRKVPLSDGAVVGDGENCEWLIAVFSDEPISIDHLLEKVEAGERVGENAYCGLDIAIESARTVRIIPVTR